VTTHLLRSIQWQVLQQEGSGTDNAHLPLQHIEQFRQLVKTRAAQKASQSGQALGIGQKLSLLVACGGHSAELEEGEWLTMESSPFLQEEHRGTQREPYRNR
jgi:hypothetical protein